MYSVSRFDLWEENMNRPIHFDLPADNPERLAQFYCDVFGWAKKKLQTEYEDWVLYTGMPDKPGMSGGVMGRYMPGTANTIEVEDIDKTLQLVTDNGGLITTEKMYIDNMGFAAWCKDLNGNYFVVAQFDKDNPFRNELMEGIPQTEWQNRPIHFEIPAKNPAELAEFYSNIFGWKVNSWGDNENYYLCYTGERSEPGIDGAISAMGDIDYVVNTIGVTNLIEYMDKVVEHGGKLHSEQMHIPNIGEFIYCLDPDGTQFGLLQPEM